MKLSVYRISLDVHDAHSGECLDMKQKDTARQIAITLTDGGFPYLISEECYAVFAATKADGKKLRHHCSIEKNTILYEVRPQTTAAVGLCECEIKLYGSGDKLLMSPGFSILVSEDAVTDDEELESEDEVDDLTHLISEATTVVTEGKNVNEQSKALIAELETEKNALASQVAAAEESAEDAASMVQRAREHANTAEHAAYKALQYSTHSDLAQNDPAAPGYIKNRTHWVANTETEIAWNGNVNGKRTYTDDFGMTYYKIHDECPEESDVIGATIEYSSGTIQTVSSKLFSGFTDGQANVGSYIYLRSGPIVSAGNVIDAEAVGVYAAIINDVYPAVFRYGEDVVHTLDEKFIPDTIARKTDIPTVPDSGQNSTVNLEGYAKETWVQEGFQPKGEYLTEVPEGYAKTEDIPTKAQDIGALPDTYTPPDQTAEQVGADPKGTADAAVLSHNTQTDAHNDLRLEVKALADRLAAFLDSDDTTLDQLSELIATINSNKSLIEAVTTGKVSVTDIIDNLTTNVSSKPLSAAQGVVLKGLIDSLSASLSKYALASAVPTKVGQLENDMGYLTEHQDISGLLPRTELDAAVEGALAQAKASGEFDGTDGKDGEDGVSPHIGDNGNWYIGSTDTGVKAAGEKGESGDSYTLTEPDKAEIVAAVIESLGGNPVFGYVDADNNIIVSGNLADGTYSAKYEMEDGSTVDIGDLVLDTNVYYSVTNTLTNCVSGNSATQAVAGGSYSAAITANSGFELSSVKVTMGGVDISSTAVSGSTISIANVTGNIVITAVAEEVETEPTNLADPTSADWLQGYRYSASSGELKNDASQSHCVTNYIPVEIGDTVSISGATLEYGQFAGDASKNKLTIAYAEGGGTYWSYTTNKFTILSEDVKFMRFSLRYDTNANAVSITVTKG